MGATCCIERAVKQGILVLSLLLIAALLIVPFAAAVPPGTLDPTFDGDGLRYWDIAFTDEFAHGVAVQPDGKIVVAGDSEAGVGGLMVARFMPDGSVDEDFGLPTIGYSIPDIAGESSSGGAVAVQPDGKIVVAGTRWDDEIADFVVVRFLANGSLDPGFGEGGFVVTGLGGSADIGRDVTLLPGGEIVVAGSSNARDEHDFALVRYLPDGSPDPSFGIGGVVLTDFGGQDKGWAIAAASSDLVVTGESDGDFAVARYNPDGSLDSGFDGDGLVVTDFEDDSPDWGRGVAVQSNGRVVVVGGTHIGSMDRFAVARYRADGALDAGFGGDGLVTSEMEFDSEAAAVAVDGSGRVVVAGQTGGGEFGVRFAVARYTPGGSLDVDFGSGGVVAVGSTPSIAEDLAFDDLGRIVVAGGHLDSEPRVTDVALARFEGRSPPGNDDFTDASALFLGVVYPSGGYDWQNATFGGSNSLATMEPGEPDHANPGGVSVWWTDTPTHSGRATFDLAGSSFDSLLAVYTGGSVDSLTLLGANDDQNWPDDRTSKVLDVPIRAGTTYHVAVDGFLGETGSIIGSYVLRHAPANDDFSSRLGIAAAGGSFGRSSQGATKEPGEPDHAGRAGGASLWWEWTPPTDGTVTIDLEGSDFDTVLALYRGSSLGSLTEVRSNDDWTTGVLSSRIEDVAVTGGITYHIAVDGFDDAMGDIDGGLEFYPPLELVGLEVNQAVQDWENSIPLIEAKDTLVRVFIERSVETGTDITGLLHGVRDGQPLPGSPLSPDNPLGDVDPPPNIHQFRDHIEHSLNFLLPFTWLFGDVTLSVEIPGDVDCREAAPPANTCTADVSFVDGGRLEVKLVPIGWEEDDGTVHSPPTKAVLDEQALRLESLMPVAWVTYRRAASPIRYDEEPDLTEVNNDLAAMRWQDGCRQSCDTIYLGVLGGLPIEGQAAGKAGGIPATTAAVYVGGVESAVADGYLRNTGVHEVAHALGRHHAVHSSLGPHPDGFARQGWCDEPARSGAPNFPTFFSIGGTTYPTIGLLGSMNDEAYGVDTRFVTGNDDLAVVNPRHEFAMMSYCEPRHLDGQGRWTSAFSYLALHYGPLARAGVDEDAVEPSGAPRASVPVILVRGSIAIDDTVTFEPVIASEAETPPPVPPAGDYSVLLLDGSGAVLDEVPFTPAEPSPGHGPADSSFLIALSGPGLDLDWVGITLDGVEIGSLAASDHAPTVSIDAVDVGNDVSMTWTGSDEDGDDLTYTVRYTPDDGVTWETLAVDTISTSLLVDPNALPGSDAARIEVVVSDGVRTGAALSDPFAVPDGAPTVSIVMPFDGRQFTVEHRIKLSALADDAEDGRLDASVRWSSDVEGDLGDSTVLDLEPGVLGPGLHEITATATDSWGNTGSASITVEILGEEPAAWCRGRAATLVGTDGDDILIGTADGDVIVGSAGNDDIDGRGGDDIICGGPGDDNLLGAAGNDLLHGEEGADIVNGGPHDDILDGGPGNDHLLGLSGADVLRGGDGDDVMNGGAGSDTLSGGPGSDRVKGGADDDELDGEYGNDTVNGGPGDDLMTGGAGDDRLFGYGGADRGSGGGGNDRLMGGTGNDMLFGDDGDDVLRGGAGDDYLDGGDGSDNLGGKADYDTCVNGERLNGCEDAPRSPQAHRSTPGTVPERTRIRAELRRR